MGSCTFQERKNKQVDLGEIRAALEQLKTKKAPGNYGITTELLKAGETPVLKKLASLFNSVIQ